MIARREIDDRGFRAVVLEPDHAAGIPVLVVSGSEGGVPEDEARALAQEGHRALALAWFGIDGLPADPLEIPLEYFGPALEVLGSEASGVESGIAVVGWSYGGMLALQLAAIFPTIGPVVAHLASGVRLNGLIGERNVPRSTFTLGGQPLPFLSEPPLEHQPWVGESDGRHLIDLSAAYPSVLEDESIVEAATIEVEHARGPILLTSGGDDRAWPSHALCEIAVRRMAVAGRAGLRSHFDL